MPTHHPPTDAQLKSWEADAMDKDKCLDRTTLALIFEVRRLRNLLKERGRLAGDVEQAVVDHQNSVIIRAAAEAAYDKHMAGPAMVPTIERRLREAKIDAVHKAKLTREVLEAALLVE